MFKHSIISSPVPPLSPSPFPQTWYKVMSWRTRHDLIRSLNEMLWKSVCVRPIFNSPTPPMILTIAWTCCTLIESCLWGLTITTIWSWTRHLTLLIESVCVAHITTHSHNNTAELLFQASPGRQPFDPKYQRSQLAKHQVLHYLFL